MKYYIDCLSEIPGALMRPSSFFAKRETSDLYTRAVATMGTILLVATLLQFLTALVNMGQLKQIVEIVRGLLPAAMRDSFFNKMDGLVPWNRLFFPILFVLYVPVIALLRAGTLRILGDSGLNLAVMQSITAYAVIPVIVVSAFTGILGNLFPVIPEPGAVPKAGLTGVIGGILSFSAGVLEMVTTVRACRAVYRQNIGRAFLTWMLPWIGLFLVTAVGTMMIYLVFGAAVG